MISEQYVQWVALHGYLIHLIGKLKQKSEINLL